MKLLIPVSMSTGSFYPKPTAYALGKIRGLGLKTVELVIQNSELGYGFFRQVNYSYFRQLVELADRSDLTVVSIHAPFFSGPDVFSSRAREEILLTTLDIASLCGSNQVVVHPYHIFLSHEGLTEFLSGGKSNPQRFVLPTLKSIFRAAEERGVNFAIENISHWSDHPLLNEPKNMISIIKSFRSVTADLDIFHSEFAGNTIEFLRTLSDSITSLHVSDISASQERTLPGKGTAKWDRIFRLAARLRNLQNVILEVTNQFDDASIRKSVAYLERKMRGG